MPVLDFVFERLKLLDTDRAALRRKRGFTDAQIDDMGVGSTGPYLRDVIVEASTRFGVDMCLELGLMVSTRAGVKPWSKYLDQNNVVIPYFNGDHVTMLRPHKFTPAGQGAQIYFAQDQYDNRAVTIAAESEFKAEAAKAYGYQAFGIPGISSFATANFERLLTELRARGIRNVVWLFDNEDKSSQDSPRFKKLAKDRWDTPFWAYAMARQCNDHKEGVYSRVAWIPDSYRGADFKADIDGLLAAGVSAADFARIVDGALDPAAFLDSLPEEAIAQINRRIAKRFEEAGRQKLTKSGGHYWYSTDDGPRAVSNFVVDYICTLVLPDGTRNYEFKLTSTTGQEATIRASAREYADTKKFRVLVAGPGMFFWSGRDDSLQELLLSVVPAEERLVNVRERSIGWDEVLEHFFFTNCVVDPNGVVVPYQEDGSVKINDELWRMAETGGDLPELYFAASGSVIDGAERANITRLLVENFGLEDVVMAMAWVCGTVLKPWLFELNHTWPILFVFGVHNSGKSRLMRWLSRIFYSRDRGSPEVLLGQVSSPFVRNRAAQTPYLPFFGDEFRNDERVAKHLDMLRGIFDHSSAGISGGEIGTTRQFSLKCALALYGEDVPNDTTMALNERMVLVRLRDKPAGMHYHLLGQLQEGFDGIFVGLLREREKLVPMIKAEFDRLTEVYRLRGASNRVAINYATIFAVAKCALGWSVSSDLVDKIFANIRTEETESNPIVEMLRACGDHWPKLGDINLRFALEAKFDDETGRVVLVFRLHNCWNAYAATGARTRSTCVPVRTMQRLVAGCPWIGRGGNARVGGKVGKAWVIDLDAAPAEVQQIAHAVADEALRQRLEIRYGSEEGSLAGANDDTPPPQF